MTECQPTASRIKKITAAITKYITNNRLTPAEAAELAGKLVFLSTTMYGKVGRSQLKTIYGRQYSQKHNDKLTHALTSAMKVLLHIITTSPPKSLTFNSSQLP